MHRLDLSAPRAACTSPAGVRRSGAACVLVGRTPLPAALREAARTRVQIDAPPGRVLSGGTFELPAAHAALSAALGPALAPGLRRTFEWYLCRGAFFHNDAHYAGVLFGVWCVDGPARDLVFPRAKVRAPVAPGDWLVFDPFEPHAVLDAGEPTYVRERYVDAPLDVYAGFEIELSDGVRAAVGIGDAIDGAVELSSRTRINAETGAIE